MKKNIVGWDSPVAIHPGKFLEDTLEDFSMSQVDLAERTGLSKKVINEILKGKNPITRPTAFKLAKVFPISEEYWINLQNIYESDKARLEEGDRIKEDKELYLQNFQETYKELGRIGIVSGLRWTGTNSDEIVLELQKFYATDSLGYVQKEIERERISFRKNKHEKEELNHYSIAAWLRLGRIKAQKTETKPFDEKKLKNILGNMVRLSQKNPHEYLPIIEQMLNECGIVLAYLPYLKNTHIQGAATWVSKDKALIMLNTTHRSEDKFWFNLFHEIGHILKHGKRESFVNLENDDVENVQEKEANSFATECLIPNFEDVVSNFNKYKNYKEAIEKIAKSIGISPSILAGRIAYELSCKGRNVYAALNSFFETKINYSNIEENSALSVYLE